MYMYYANDIHRAAKTRTCVHRIRIPPSLSLFLSLALSLFIYLSIYLSPANRLRADLYVRASLYISDAINGSREAARPAATRANQQISSVFRASEARHLLSSDNRRRVCRKNRGRSPAFFRTRPLRSPVPSSSSEGDIRNFFGGNAEFSSELSFKYQRDV